VRRTAVQRLHGFSAHHLISAAPANWAFCTQFFIDEQFKITTGADEQRQRQGINGGRRWGWLLRDLRRDILFAGC